jgi:hypothetical protein
MEADLTGSGSRIFGEAPWRRWAFDESRRGGSAGGGGAAAAAAAAAGTMRRLVDVGLPGQCFRKRSPARCGLHLPRRQELWVRLRCAAAASCVTGGVCATTSVVCVIVSIGDGGGRSGGGADGPAWRVAILADGCIAIVGGSTRSENRRIRNSGTAGASRCLLNVGSQKDGYF